MSLADLGQPLLLVLIGAIASGVNAVAGGGTLLSFPVLTLGLGMPEKVANVTNAAGLWPGSLAGGLGFLNALAPTRQYLRTLLWPTLLGSVLGAVLLLQTGERAFQVVVPFLILGATLLLAFQSRIKAFSLRHSHEMPPAAAAVLQFLVSVYGGYFGAGMGIMMLAVFTLYMEGNLHEMNAAKNWLGLLINFVATGVFLLRGHIVVGSAVALAIGAVLGGFAAARWSQRVDPERLRPWIAAYGFAAAAYFMARTWA